MACWKQKAVPVKINKEVAERIDEALETVDAEERTQKLTEGKNLPLERNKHVLLAEKYGWDTVTCYTADPLASHSDDKNKIRKAVKDGTPLREEKKELFLLRFQGQKELFHGLRIVGLFSSGTVREVQHHLWWENRIRFAMGNPSVFVASNQYSLPGIVQPPIPLTQLQNNSSHPSDVIVPEEVSNDLFSDMNGYKFRHSAHRRSKMEPENIESICLNVKGIANSSFYLCA